MKLLSNFKLPQLCPEAVLTFHGILRANTLEVGVFLHDPTHVRAITPVGLSLFSQRLNREWQANGRAFSLLGLYLGVNFELVQTVNVPSEIWFERYSERSGDTELLLKESAIYNNLIKQVEMTLVAVK